MSNGRRFFFRLHVTSCSEPEILIIWIGLFSFRLTHGFSKLYTIKRNKVRYLNEPCPTKTKMTMKTRIKFLFVLSESV